MTITLYLEKTNLLDSIKTLKCIFDAGSPELVEPLSNFLNPVKVYTDRKDLNVCNPVAIQVTLEEFALIGVFNKGNI